jgi:hypothetical protein
MLRARMALASSRRDGMLLLLVVMVEAGGKKIKARIAGLYTDKRPLGTVRLFWEEDNRGLWGGVFSLPVFSLRAPGCSASPPRTPPPPWGPSCNRVAEQGARKSPMVSVGGAGGPRPPGSSPHGAQRNAGFRGPGRPGFRFAPSGLRWLNGPQKIPMV